MSDDVRKLVYQNAAIAGIKLSPERADAVAAARERTAELMARLLRIDYSETEPALRFMAPPPDES